MLAKILNGKVVEIISETDSAFPDVPIKKRFSKEFLKDCIECDEGVELGHIYSEGKFSVPKPDPEELDIPLVKADPTVRQEIESIKAQIKTVVEAVSKILDFSGGKE